jgi:hypothetical protein
VPDASADGGLVLVKALDTELGLTQRLAGCLDDAREPGKVLHETIELLQQRIFGLCGGYADCNDAARLVHDPIHKLVVGRDPVTGLGLASQPTLSRFENAVSARELHVLTYVLADTVIAQQRRRLHGRATRITIDLDPTDDPTHGQQEFAFFNGHYDTWCYLPLVATVMFNDEAAQFAVAAVLRPGKAPAGLGARGLLRRLLRKLRTAFPAATFRVRLDGGFASPNMFTFLEREQVEYVVGMSSNQRLEKRARRLMGRARVRSRQTSETAHLYGETRYAAKKWSRKGRIIINAEIVRHPGAKGPRHRGAGAHDGAVDIEREPRDVEARQRLKHELLVESDQRPQRLLREAPQPVAHGARRRHARQAREAAHEGITPQVLQVLQPPGADIRQRQEQQGEARAAVVPAERRARSRSRRGSPSRRTYRRSSSRPPYDVSCWAANVIGNSRLTTCRNVPMLKRIRGASTNRGMAWGCRPF